MKPEIGEKEKIIYSYLILKLCNDYVKIDIYFYYS